MFHIVMAGPLVSAQLLVDALSVEGFPAQIAVDRGGFPAEDDTEFVEAVAIDEGWLARALDVAGRFGYALRLHGQIAAPTEVPA